MKLPDWMRATRTRRTSPGTVTVDLTIDTSNFEDAMWRAHEATADLRYRRRIAHERSLGQAFVGVQLDNLCRDLGLDPVQTWRIPRANEERDRRNRAAFAMQQWAATSVAAMTAGGAAATWGYRMTAPTRASLLAQLRATSDADAAAKSRRYCQTADKPEGDA